MNLDAAQYQQIATIVYGGPDGGPTPAEAELVVSLCQLAVQADEVEDADEAALFEDIARSVYGHANIDTTPPEFHPLADRDQRLDLIKSTAAQLAGKPSAGLAYALAYILAVSDFDLAPEEGELLEDLADALAIDPDRADELIATATEVITPPE